MFGICFAYFALFYLFVLICNNVIWYKFAVLPVILSKNKPLFKVIRNVSVKIRKVDNKLLSIETILLVSNTPGDLV